MMSWVFSILCCLVSASQAAEYVNLTRIGYSGTIALFPVSKEKIAQKLNDIKELDSCHGGTLNLPNYTILQKFLKPWEHVIGVSIGNLTAKSFVNTLSTSTAAQYSLEAPTVQFFVPFLTGPDPNGPPNFKMTLSSYVSTDKPFLNPNMGVPAVQVDKLVIDENGVMMEDGDELFHVSWREEKRCRQVNYVINASVDDYINELIIPFDYKLDFSACDPSDVQHVDLCMAYNEMNCVLSRNWLNSCEYWAPMEPFSKCKLKSFTLEGITEGFQKRSMLYGEPKLPIVYEMQHEADFSANIKVPCMEQF